MAINLAKKASDKVAERFKLASATEGLFTAKYNWSGVATVQVYSVDTLPLNDYNKSTNPVSGSRFGTMTEVGDTIQEMTVADDKSFNGVIDKGNNTAQMMIKSASSILRRETDEVIIPYVDKYRLAKLANGAATVTVNSTALTKSTFLEAIAAAGAALDNLRVPREGRVMFIGATKFATMKLADQIVNLENAGAKAVVNGEVGMIDGNHIRMVPDYYLPANVNFMIVKKGVACAPKKIETMRILTEDSNVDGSIVQGRLLHDCFVLGAQCGGIAVHTTAGIAAPTITASSGTVTITPASGSTKCYYTLDGSDPKTSASRVEGTISSGTVTVSSVADGTTVRAYSTKTGSLNSGITDYLVE